MRSIAPIILLLVSALACRNSATSSDDQMPQRSITEVLQTHVDELMAIDGVNSVGQTECDGDPCISVGVVRLSKQLREQIPTQIEGYAVRIHEQGPVRAH